MKTLRYNIATPKIVLENGKPSEVILRWKDFQKLLKKIEIEDIYYNVSETKRIKENIDEIIATGERELKENKTIIADSSKEAVRMFYGAKDK